MLNGVEVAELFLANGDVLCQVKYPDGQSEVRGGVCGEEQSVCVHTAR